MQLSIEKRPLNNEENYFVFRNGEKSIEMPVNSVKAILLLWTFFSVTFISFFIGQMVNQNNLMITAYMLQGNVTDLDGHPVDCKPVMTPKKIIEWQCTNSTTVS